MTKRNSFLGILQLDTQFPRILGDAGNLNSYAFPAQSNIIMQADVPNIVNAQMPSKALQASFIQGAIELEQQGAFAIISTCGFLIHIQSVIADSVSIPVCLSALSDYKALHKQYNGAHIAIITASKNSLTPNVLSKASINASDVSVIGMEDCHAFSQAILRAKEEQPQRLDEQSIEAACIDKAKQLIKHRPDTAAILLECGNLPPYAEAIQKAVQRPVHSILDTANKLYACRHNEKS